MHDVKPPRPAPEIVRPTVGLGSSILLSPPPLDRSGLEPHPGPSGLASSESLKRHATRSLTLAVSRALFIEQLLALQRVLSLTDSDALHMLADVYDELRQSYSPAPAPPG